MENNRQWFVSRVLIVCIREGIIESELVVVTRLRASAARHSDR